MTYAQIMVAYCRAQLGKPYKLGASGPARFDCSGLTKRAAGLIGLNWYHGASTQWHRGSATGDAEKYGYWTKTGKISDLPEAETAFLFHRDSAIDSRVVMAHTGMYDGATGHVIQAGGYGGSGVHEGALDRRRWSHWAMVADAEVEKPTIQTGSKGAAVALLQMQLGISVDGNFGEQTRAALVAFQSEHGLPADGICNADTWEQIGEPAIIVADKTHATVRVGSTGEAVRALQTALNKAGAMLVVDGSFGPLTESALKAYQTAQKIEADGICGPVTWGKIYQV